MKVKQSGRGRPRLDQSPIYCFDCEMTNMHRDGAVFCSVYAARKKEGDRAPLGCHKGRIRRSGRDIPKCRTPH